MRATELAKRVFDGPYLNLKRFNQAVRDTAANCGLEVYSYPLIYGSETAELLGVVSNYQTGGRVFIQTSGFHGNETAPFLSTVVNLPALARCARGLGVGIKVYPLVNPLGAAAATRYSPQDNKMGVPNGDFMRYYMADGRVLDDLGEEESFIRWAWADEVEGYLPPETRQLSSLLRAEVKKSRIVGLMDNHAVLIAGDLATDLDCPAMYAYVFRPPQRYFGLMNRAQRTSGVPPWQEKPVSTEIPSGLKTDNRGIILDRHDASFIDLAHQLGIEAITIEVSGDTPLDQAAQVYRIWSLGFLGLVARG